MMESLCLSQEMVDCSISAGKRKISAHRMILSTCSSYFRALFASLAPHQYPVIVINDTEDEIMELLVRQVEVVIMMMMMMIMMTMMMMIMIMMMIMMMMSQVHVLW